MQSQGTFNSANALTIQYKKKIPFYFSLPLANKEAWISKNIAVHILDKIMYSPIVQSFRNLNF